MMSIFQKTSRLFNIKLLTQLEGRDGHKASRKRSSKTMLALALLFATLITSLAPPIQVEAAKRRYLRDVYTSDSYYQDVRYCNEHYMFGDKLGKSDRLQPKKIITKGKAIDYLYNFYLPALGEITPHGRRYDNTNYFNNYYYLGDNAWTWALATGIVSGGEDDEDTATMTWFYEVMNNFAYYVDGGWMKFGNRRSNKLHKYDVCRVLYVTRKTKYKVERLERLGGSNDDLYYYYTGSNSSTSNNYAPSSYTTSTTTTTSNSSTTTTTRIGYDCAYLMDENNW